jgi:adenylylsulfate kinase-like enzyme
MSYNLYWFTGQPGAGKTTLALMLKEKLEKNHKKKKFVILDGDEIRDIFNNKDYSKQGRLNNVEMVQNCCSFLIKNKIVPIVCMVSPFREQRLDFCKKVDGCEIFVETTDIRGREYYHVDYYERPFFPIKENQICIDTTNTLPEKAIKSIPKRFL